MAPLQLFVGRDLAAFFRILLVISRFSADLSILFEDYILLTGESPQVLMASVVNHLKGVYEGHVTIPIFVLSAKLTSKVVFWL